MEWYPILVLAVGVALVIGLILGLRINAFIALIVSAIVVSLMAPGEMADKIPRVGEAFGKVAGAIGIVIAMAAVIGKCLMDSGAAERIVRSLTGALGEKRTPLALMSSGYVLSVPVFFDTVFYLVVPVVRSLWKEKRKNYVLYLTAVVAGGAVTHSMVPPTPGPLFMANELGIDLGTMMIVGGLVGIPMSLAGLFVCRWLNEKMPLDMRPYPGEDMEPPADDAHLPPLWASLAPVVLPVLLISSNTIASAIAKSSEESAAQLEGLLQVTGVLGNPSFALLLSAALSLVLVAKYRGDSLKQLAESVEHALMSGGLVILITAAGGAFGAMLREAGIQDAFASLLGDSSSTTGVVVLFWAFAIASLIKFAQGSGTVAMITTASMFAAMGFNADTLSIHPVYLACAIGSGSLVGDWMNNSGFWIFAKMGGLTPNETLRTWSVLTAALGATGIVVTTVLALILPMGG